MRRWLSCSVVALVLFGLVLGACARATPAPTPAVAPTPTPVAPAPAPVVVAPTPVAIAKPTGELRLALSYLAAETLDPTLGPHDVKFFATNLYDPLVGAAPQNELSPQLGVAEKWEASADKKTWTFYLKKGIKFHNGDELSAEDVKFSIERFTSPKSVSTNASALRKMVDRIDISDPYTVVVRLKEPYGFMDYFLSNVVGAEGMVMPRKYIQEKGEEYFNRTPIGSGPYKFKEQVLGSYMVFEALESHWSGVVPKFKRLIFYVVPEETTRIAMLKLGQADIIDITREGIKELKGFSIFEKKGIINQFSWTTKQWDPATYLYDKRVREAINLAINRQEIVDHIFMGQAVAQSYGLFFGPVAIGYQPMPLYPFDPERAKRLVAEAFPAGVSLDIYSYSYGGVPESLRVNEAMASYLGKVGVKTKIIPIDYAGFRTKQSRAELANALAVHATEDRPFIGLVMVTKWHSTGLLTQAKDPTLDAIIDELNAALDIKQVAERQLKLRRYIRDNHMVVGIVNTGLPYAGDPKKVKGWEQGMVPKDLNIPRGIR